MDLQKIFTLNREQILALDPKDVQVFFNDEAIVHIASVLGAYWRYDYEAADQGKVGCHAELKSLNHSDGFFVSKIMFQHQNVLEIMAFQLVYKYRYLRKPQPKWVAGIPEGATKLGRVVAKLMESSIAEMEKVDGRIKLLTQIPPFETLLLVEDFCTKGTGFKEAATEIKKQLPRVSLLPYELVVLNRGQMGAILVDDIGRFEIVSAANFPVDDWNPQECPLCRMGSKPIKPKATDENWQIITTSQQ